MTQTTPVITSHLNTKLAAYAALAGAALAAPAVANADIIYSGALNYNIQTTNTNGLYINFVTGATNLAGNGAGSTVPGWDFGPYSSSGTATGNLNLFTSTTAANINQVVGSGTVVSALTFGTLIGPASTLATAGVVSTAGTSFRNTQNMAYVGIRFRNEVTGINNYGWALLSTTAATGFPATVISYGYENTGAAIAAGAIPEPTTTALFGVMAVGALGVRAWRKRKAA